MSGTFSRIQSEDYKSIVNVINHKYPERATERAEWGMGDFIFCGRRSDPRVKLDEIGEWLDQTGIPFHTLTAGSFHFVELKTEADAVAFKLRWY